MKTKLDVILNWPNKVKGYDKLRKYFDSVESIESCFKIQFSCGDGKYFDDFYYWSDNQYALICSVSDEELLKYDGAVCTSTPPRFTDSKQIFDTDKDYRFTVKYHPIPQHETYYINNKEVYRRWVG